MTNQPKTEVEIDGKWRELKAEHVRGKTYQYAYINDSGYMVLIAHPTTFPTRVAEAEAGDGWKICGDSDDRYWIQWRGELLTQSGEMTSHALDPATDLPTRADAEAALAKWREKQKPKMKFGEDPGVKIVEVPAFTPTPHEPCEGVKLWVTGESTDNLNCGAYISVDDKQAGSLFYTGCDTWAMQQDVKCIPARNPTWLEFTHALAAFRDRVRAERKAKPEPGPTLGERARKASDAMKTHGDRLWVSGVCREDESRAFIALATLAAVAAERDHWKANHDEMVRQKRMLQDRPDLADRAKSIEKLRSENIHLAAELERLKSIEAAAGWLRCVERQREHDENEGESAGQTFCSAVLADASKQLDAALAAKEPT